MSALPTNGSVPQLGLQSPTSGASAGFSNPLAVNPWLHFSTGFAGPAYAAEYQPGTVSPNAASVSAPPSSNNNTNNNGGGGGGGQDINALFHAQTGGNIAPVGWNPGPSVDAAQAAYNAQNSALNTQFDKSAADLNAQLPYLQQQRDSSLSSLNLANQQAIDQANNARLSAQTNTTDQINQAGDVAHQTQNQNRNILRALGIGGGTYAAELLSKPLNIYDQQRGQLNTALQQRSQQLDDYLNGVTQQHAQAVSDLQNNYANLVGKIQSDLRFNDRQRNDALQAANAALQTNLANIQSSAQQYAQQVQLMKQQLAQSAGTVTNYANPTFDPQAYQNALLSNGQAGQSQTGNLQALTLDDLKKDVSNGALTLSGGGQ